MFLVSERELNLLISSSFSAKYSDTVSTKPLKLIHCINIASLGSSAQESFISLIGHSDTSPSVSVSNSSFGMGMKDSLYNILLENLQYDGHWMDDMLVRAFLLVETGGQKFIRSTAGRITKNI